MADQDPAVEAVQDVVAQSDPLYDAAVIPHLLAKIGALTVRGEMQAGQVMDMQARYGALVGELERRDRAIDALAKRLKRSAADMRKIWDEELQAPASD